MRWLMLWENFMKIKILLFGCLCLLISGEVEAKDSKNKKTEQIQKNKQSDVMEKEKPKMCYTHTKKWHPCPVQPKNEKEKTQ